MQRAKQLYDPVLCALGCFGWMETRHHIGIQAMATE